MSYLKTYSNFLKKHLKITRPLKIVCDASNGVAGMVLKEVFGNYPKVKMILINGKPDGRFPAHGPNPLAEGALEDCAKRVKKEKADFGAVFDADGDRVFFIDEKGRPIPSFLASALLFQNSSPPHVADEPVYQALKMLKIIPLKKLFPSRIGTFFIKAEMSRVKAGAAGEYSGHFYFKEFFGSDSGVMALIKVMNFLSKENQSLSDYLRQFSNFSILMENKPFTGDFEELKKNLEKKFSKKALRVEKRDGLTFVFRDSFLNVRPSNTEPLIRLTCGAFDKKTSKHLLNSLHSFK